MFIWWILIKSFYLWSVLMLFMYLEMMGKSLSLIWDDLEVMTDNSTKILKFCKIHVQWLFSRPVTIFVSSVQWLFCVQCPMIIFTSNIQCRVQWPFLSPVINCESNDQFWVQWPVLSPVIILSLVINFESSDQFESNNQFWVQWSILSSVAILSLMISLESNDHYKSSDHFESND